MVLVVFAVLIFMGIASFFKLPIELVPKFNPPLVTIITVYPGASPTEVENTVGKPIEDAISSLEGIDQIQVISNENTSFVSVEMRQEVDIDRTVTEITRKINQIQASFPREVRTPVVNKFALDELPVMRLGLSSTLSGTAFFDLVKNRVTQEIAQVKGVAQVGILGGEEREIKINVNSTRLEQYGLSLLQVTQAVQMANLDFPTGKVSDAEGQMRIRLAGKFHSLDEIRNLVIGKSRFGSSIYLKDIAEVQDGVRDMEVICRSDGQPSLGLIIRKQSDANAVEMADLILEKVGVLESKYEAEGLKIQVIANSSLFTKRATEAVIHDLFTAVLLVGLVMLMFLHSLRNAVIVLISIPVSIISTFIMMYLLGYSLNLMSLLGLSLAIGILVDDAIVVIENIYRHLELGKNRVQASYDGRKEIGFTAISITLVDVVVFLPIVLTVGLVPNLLRQFCMTVLTSTLMSLLVSFTVVPWLTSRLAKAQRYKGKTMAARIVLRFESFLEWSAEGFVSALKWALKSRRNGLLTVMAATVAFGASFLLVSSGLIGNAFFDPGDRGEYLLQLDLPKDASLSQTDVVSRKFEEWLLNQSEVERIYATVGTNNKAFGLTSPHTGEILVLLKPLGKGRTVSTNILARQTKVKLEETFGGVRVKTSPIDILGLSFMPIEVMLNGPDLDVLLREAGEIERLMAEVPGCVEIERSVEGGNPEIKIDVNRQRMADNGLTMAMVGMTLQTAFSGNNDARFREGDYEYPVRVGLDAFNRRSKEDINRLSFINPLGNSLYLSQFAIVSEGSAPTRLERRDRMPSVMISAQVIGRPNGSVSRDIKKQLDAHIFPAGTYVRYGGDLKRQEQGISTLGFALWVSLALVYLILVALYDNWIYPMVVLVSIPLSVIGALLALALTQENLTVFTGLGLVMLVGLVGKNAILVVDFANQLRAEGVSIVDALLRATRLRFRPVLMTNIAMVIGLLPLALADGAGAHWKNGLAWAIIGGLNSSMLLSLIVVPVVYRWFDWISERLGLNRRQVVDFGE